MTRTSRVIQYVCFTVFIISTLSIEAFAQNELSRARAAIDTFHKFFNAKKDDQLDGIRSRGFRDKKERLFFLFDVIDLRNLSGKALDYKVLSFETTAWGAQTKMQVVVETRFENATTEETFDVSLRRNIVSIDGYSHGTVPDDADVKRHLEIWKKAGVRHYSFEAWNVNSGFTSVWAPALVTVIRGENLSIVPLDSTDKRKLYDAPATVEGLFDQILELRRDGYGVGAEYDDVLGYPRDISGVSRNSNGWVHITIKNFRRRIIPS